MALLLPPSSATRRLLGRHSTALRHAVPSVETRRRSFVRWLVEQASVESTDVGRQPFQVSHGPARQASEHLPVISFDQHAAPPARGTVWVALGGNSVHVVAGKLRGAGVARICLLAQLDDRDDELGGSSALKPTLVPPRVS